MNQKSKLLGVTGSSSADDSNVPETGGDVQDDEAPSEDELNEADDSRGAAAKGVDDNSSSEAVAMDKAGLIDLDDQDQLAKIDTYVEVSQKASHKLDEKVAAADLGEGIAIRTKMILFLTWPETLTMLLM